jgi:hypothetical protein
MMVPDWSARPATQEVSFAGVAMFPLIFSILWTVASTVIIATNFEGLSPFERALAVLFPLFGLFAVRTSWLHWRRRSSLRIQENDGATWYVWIELDGSERRSTRDPRDDWDSDSGGDGSGDGGGD